MRHRMRRSNDLTSRSEAIAELQTYLDLAEAPLRIECVDVSTLQGTDTVASLVVFEDGLPRKRDYRTFIIRTEGADDLASVREVVERRFARVKQAELKADDAGGAGTAAGVRRAARSPCVSAGPARLTAHHRSLLPAGFDGSGVGDIPVVGLAKRLEEVWTPDSADPVILPRTSEALYLLQRIRDEAHRTAIALHRKRRTARQRRSALDDIPGLGPKKAAALLAHFGSVRSIRAASTDELQKVPGIGPTVATTVHEALASSS